MNDMSREKDVPPGIAGKEAVIFGNMTEIYEFHSKYVCIRVYVWVRVGWC